MGGNRIKSEGDGCSDRFPLNIPLLAHLYASAVGLYSSMSRFQQARLFIRAVLICALLVFGHVFLTTVTITGT